MGHDHDAKTKTDVLMRIKPEHMANIVNTTTNHDFPKYLLPASVERNWLSISAPEQGMRYVARLSQGKQPGEVTENGGLGAICPFIGEARTNIW